MVHQCLRFIMDTLRLKIKSKVKEFEVSDFIMSGVYGGTFFCWVAVGYLLMLAMMNYNTGIFFAITTGGAFGYSIFNVFLYYPPDRKVLPDLK
jgi:hypothetical protein